jgi:hypothetical protein
MTVASLAVLIDWSYAPAGGGEGHPRYEHLLLRDR